MTIAEILEAIEHLSPDERERVAECLQVKKLAASSEYRARVGRAHEQIAAGRSVTIKELGDTISDNKTGSKDC